MRTLGACLAGGLAGCLGPDRVVSVLAAGSLAAALEGDLGPAYEDRTGVAYRGEYHGSAALLNLVADGERGADVVISADAGLLRTRLSPELATWDVAFASNVLGIVHDPGSALGARLDEGAAWYDVLPEAPAGSLSVADPELDPLGYRTVMALGLAARVHDRPGLAATVLERAHVEPDEPRLLAGVETGARAAAVVYANMAGDRGLPFRPFPAAYNFADPDRARRYARASYTFEDGRTVRGRPIAYAATVPATAPRPGRGRSFLRFLLGADELLASNGLRTTGFPRYVGQVPAEVRLP